MDKRLNQEKNPAPRQWKRGVAVIEDIEKDINSRWVLTFGKYKHYRICDIPINYIKWLLNNVDNGSISKPVLQKLLNVIRNEEENFSSIFSRGSNGNIFQLKIFRLIITLEWK